MLFRKISTAALLASAGMMLSFGSASAEQMQTQIDAYYAPIHFEFDGKHLVPPDEQKGFIYEGSTYVPLRFIAYSLDKAVDWDPDTYTVTVREPSKSEKVSIQEYKINREVKNVLKEKVDTSLLAPTSIPVYFEQVEYVFDGEKKQPPQDLPGLIYQDSLYVPMRFMSESIGKEINWDPETYTVTASTAGMVEEPTPDITPAPSPSPSPTPGGGAPGGGTTTKPSLDSLVVAKTIELYSTQSVVESMLRGYEASYKAAATDDERVAIESQAESYVAQVTADFHSNMDAYESTLRGYGYDTSSADMFRSAFDQKVAEGRASVGY